MAFASDSPSRAYSLESACDRLLLPETPRIAIVRLSSIGDCILTLPTLCALRHAFPRAHLAWVTEPATAQLLSDHEALDELIVMPRRWLITREGWKKLWQLRQQRFNLVIDPQGLLKSALIGYCSGVQLRVGFACPWSREGSHCFYSHVVCPRQAHLVDAQRELLRLLSDDLGPVEFCMPRYTPECHRINAWQKDVLKNQPFVAIHLGATWPSRRWPVERWAALARLLNRRLGLVVVVVWGNTLERLWAERVVQLADGNVQMAPPTTLRELAALLSEAKLFVAADSGPLHIAAAYGVPTVGLYAVTRCERSGPYGIGNWVIQVNCKAAARRKRQDPRWVQTIYPEVVFEACYLAVQKQNSGSHVPDYKVHTV